ncbi:MAG TPA: DUF4062 domain-containing protein [Mucilaginibacter sp.]|nr:DUF4062 domain-containing protein [Mucilaginibacter sp.]
MERKYQIFISSTYVDLIDERQEVTRQILNNYHFPVGMEMFAPSDKAQWEIIEKTIDSSDIYILLLGYRYGSLLNTAGNDTSNQRSISYTEKEFEYAVKKKKPIIVFIKDDINLIYLISKLEKAPADERCTVETWKDTLKKVNGTNYGVNQIERLKNLRTGPDILEYIYDNKYDRDQARIGEFRSKVHDRLIGKFSKDKKIDVQNAISQKIKSLPSGGWVQEKNVRRSWLSSPKYLLAIFTILICIVGISNYIIENRTEQNRLSLQNDFQQMTLKFRRQSVLDKLKINNPVLFDMAQESDYELARVFFDITSLEKETPNLTERINKATESFSIYTTSYRRLIDNIDAIANAAKRGVAIHILLLDTSINTYESMNRLWFYNLNPAEEVNNKRKARNNIRDNINYLKDTLKNMKEKFKNNVELKFSTKPQYYGVWIIDPSRPEGLAHVSLSVTYTGFKPNFRVSANSSKRLFNELNNQFNKAWADTTNLRYNFKLNKMEKNSP